MFKVGRLFEISVLFFCYSNCFSQSTFTIKGVVKNKSNSTLDGASIQIKEPLQNVITNENGEFYLKLTEGKYTLTSSYITCFPSQLTFDLQRDTSIIITLEEKDLITEEITISADNNKSLYEAKDIGKLGINMLQVKKLPSFLGEPDIIKTIQYMPGIVSAGEGSSAFFVRGGNADENLILLDDAPIYDPSHLLGLFSIFNTDIIKGANLYRNGMPANYGGRISSLLDINTKEGNNQKYVGNVSLGLVAAKIYLSGPLVKDKITFSMGIRRSYADQIVNAGSLIFKSLPKNNSLYFYDLNAKLTYNINPKDTVSLSTYYGQDYARLDKSVDMGWGNEATTLSWKHKFKKGINVNTKLIYSSFGFKLVVNNQDQNFFWTNSISEYIIKQSYSLVYNSKNTFEWGVFINYRLIDPAKFKPVTPVSLFNSVSLPTTNSTENAVYFSHKLAILPSLQIHYGLRYSTFITLGPLEEKIYENPHELILPRVSETRSYKKFQPINVFNAPEPRITISYQINSNTSIKGSYNRMAQYVHQIITGTTPLPVTFWMPSSTYIKPSIGNNFSMGLFKNLPLSLEGSVELFYKHRTNTLDFADNASILLNPDVITQIRSGSSKAYGFEMFISKSYGKFKWSSSYTYSIAERQINGVNLNKIYYAPFDRRHSVSFLGTYDFSSKWSIGLSWAFATGRPITLPSGTYQFQQYKVNYITERNGYRMPDYHRLDISTTFRPETKRKLRLKSEWTLSVYNVYNRQNAFAIYTQPKFSGDNAQNTLENTGLMIYLFTIVPSLSYNLRF